MIDLLSVVAVSLYAGVLALLLPFAAHRMVLLIQSRKKGGEDPVGTHNTYFTQNTHSSAIPAPPVAPRSVSGARVTVQLPVFNEKHVVERLIDAACRLRHPAELLQIQVLDDSTDETTALAEQCARKWRRRGVDVSVLHRSVRTGYKAGALAAGLDETTGDFILILDADFVPAPCLLESLLPVMRDPGVGLVQARWDHINERDSWLTRAQALLLDGHFLVEQRGRYLGGRFFNFNGTAGLWRRQALLDAGGWEHDTLTEDLDISYRAQMAGWRFVLRDDIGVPAELPGTAASLLVQQRRWAQGGVQTARKVLPRLLRGRFRPAVKLEAFLHLSGHLAHPLTFVLALLIVPSAIARSVLGVDRLWWLDLAVFASATGPFVLFYLTAARKRGRRWGHAIRAAAGTLTLGAGMSVLLSRAVLRGLGRFRDPFERTPKAGAVGRSSYERPRGTFSGQTLAIAAGSFMVLSGTVAIAQGYWASLPFVALFASGYLALGLNPGRTAHSQSSGPG
ncbi:MAG: glycosyltransferase [Gemmatimonadetes bacterium]|nr:glycosyltransferase [Gemmatimonadota bacterium]